jgi:hypothetical protein
MSDQIVIEQRTVVRLTDASRAGGHLCVAVCHEDANGMMLMVPICTVAGAHENECVVNVGDLPEVKHPSYAAYQLVKYVDRANLQRLIREGDASIGGPLADGVFARIVAGFRASRHVTPRTLKYFETNVGPRPAKK